MTDPLRDIASRPHRYENVDGTTEISFSLMIFAMVLVGYLTAIAEKNALLPHGFGGYALVFVGTWVPFVLFGTVLTRTIKRHITYPRTGYVAYRRITGENRWRTVFFAVALSVAAAILAALAPLIQRNHESSMVRALMIFGFLGPYAFFALNASKEHPWKRYMVCAMAIGLLTIAFLVPGSTERLSRPVMVFSGSAWLVSGVATLAVYIRNTHAPAVGDE
jgi:hypothetical protein